MRAGHRENGGTSRRGAAIGRRVVASVAFCCLLAFTTHAAEWVQVNIPGSEDLWFEKVHFVTPTEGWLLAHGPVLSVTRTPYYIARTYDSGGTWSVEPIDTSTSWTLTRADFLDPSQGWAPAGRPTTLNMFIEAGGHHAGEDNGLHSPVTFYQTTDGGASWERRQGELVGLTYFGDQALARSADRKFVSRVHFTSPSTGFAGGLIGQYVPEPQRVDMRGWLILTTRDGGATWKAFAYGARGVTRRSPGCWDTAWNAPVEHIVSVGDRYVWMSAAACTTGYLFRSRDAGLSWQAVLSDEIMGQPVVQETPGIAFISPNEGISWAHDWLGATSDGGASWRLISEAPVEDLVLFPSGEGWLLGQMRAPPSSADYWINGIFHTLDGGATWTLGHPSTSLADESRIQYAQASDAVWALGRSAVLVRHFDTTAVSVRDSLPATWGDLKAR